MSEAIVRYHGSDVCECGDFFSQHPHCICGCPTFRFSHVASKVDRETWDKYRAKQWNKEQSQ